MINNKIANQIPKLFPGKFDKQPPIAIRNNSRKKLTPFSVAQLKLITYCYDQFAKFKYWPQNLEATAYLFLELEMF